MTRTSVAALVLVVLVMPVSGCSSSGRADRSIQVGVPAGPATTAAPGPVIVPPEDDGGATEAAARGLGIPLRGRRREPASRPGLAQPDGRPWPPPIAFVSATPVPSNLVFVLAIGSDARPNEDPARARADSIHLLAVDPATRRGTVLGFPRDSWVEIPGHGRGKINDALARGGPDLLAATVRRLTGLPVDYYVLSGFAGFTRMVDDLGGVDVPVQRRMDDRFSGAHFERGWHRFDGGEALAFSRNRHDVAYGDFSRSENQGVVLLSALAKLRGEVGDDNGLRAWLRVLTRWARLDVPADHLPRLAALARRVDPAALTNVVAPGRIGTAGRQSVVYLGAEAARLFEDLRDDATIDQSNGGGGGDGGSPTTTAEPSTTSTSPPRSPVPTTTTTTRPPDDATTTTRPRLPLP